MPANAAPPVHVIVKLPYNRPEGATDPPVVIWTPEKEAMLWEVLSRYRGSDSSGIDWPGLSDHLKVPLPFLLYRAQVRYEEDLRVLQGNLGASTALAPPRPGLDIKATERSAVSTPTRTPLSLRGSPLPPVSRHATPIAIPKNRIITQRASPHGLQSSQYLLRNSPITASTATLQARLSPSRPVPSSPLTVRRAPSPPSSHSPSSSSGDEDEDRKEENREEVDRQLKTLEKMMSSQLLGFARPKVDISKARERLNASMIKASTKLDKLDSPQKLTPTSSIPSIPSPPPEMKTESSPVGAIRGSAPVSPAVRPPGQGARNKATGRNPTMHSHHGSSASSFSDISDGSISTSALEDALTSNLRQGSSRMSSFTRGPSRPGV